MKKLLMLFAVAMIGAVAGCSQEDYLTNEEPAKPQNPNENKTEDQIEIAEREVNFESVRGARTIKFQAPASWTVSLVDDSAEEWCSIMPKSGSNAGQFSIIINVSGNGTPEERSASIQIQSGTATETIVVTQNREVPFARESLIALYNALDGDNWTENTNWCTDKSIDEWFGVTVLHETVWYIDLQSNNLNGELPPEIGNFPDLEYLTLQTNRITGQLPSELGNLTKLRHVDMHSNLLSGTVPQSVQETDWWITYWVLIADFNYIDLSTATIPAPEFSGRSMEEDKIIISSSIYAENDYTVLFKWADWCPYSQAFTPTLIQLYEKYHNRGLEVIGYTLDVPLQDAMDFITKFEIPWQNIYDISPIKTCMFPAINVVDRNGVIVFNCVSDNYLYLEDFLREHFGDEDTE